MYQHEIREVSAQPVAFIRFQARLEEVGARFGDIFPAVFAYIGSKSVAPAGAPYARYVSMPGETLDIEAGIPTLSPVPAEDRVDSGELPGGRVVYTLHVGPYDKLSDAHDAVNKWIAEEGLEIAGPPWECYVSDPTEAPPAEWKTEIYYPIS